MPMEKEEILWIIGLIMIIAGIALMIWGGYYIYAGSVVSAMESSTESAAADAGVDYQSAGYGAMLTTYGIVLLISGIALIIIGLFLVYKFKIKAA